MNKYEYTKYLSFTFYKYCSIMNNWKNEKSEYIEIANEFIEKFNTFKKKITNYMIKSSTTRHHNLREIKELREMIDELMIKYCDVVSLFEEKYGPELFRDINYFAKNSDKLKLFLAEYVAYNSVENLYDNLIILESSLKNVENAQKVQSSRKNTGSQPGEF